MFSHCRNTAVGITASLLILSGCSNAIEETQTSLSDIEAQQEAAIQSFTQLADLESRLQSEFETVLEEDEDLSTLSDGSAQVHTNIEERRGALEALSETSGELLSQHEEMTQIDSDEISEEAVNGVLDSLDSVTGSLDEFTSAYEEQLSSQTAYFESLGQDDSSYETFQKGIEAVNDEMEGIRALRIQLDEEFVALEEAHSTLSSQLEETSNE
ncbi:YkyA family protein [Salinicoccus bachuensis]|uniref:YkyA family protein n=1 Tax=Salinicoccus bachuensis TaxID=3136731 RepID=A0ABZ3CI12_9STAP